MDRNHKWLYAIFITFAVSMCGWILLRTNIYGEEIAVLKSQYNEIIRRLDRIETKLNHR